MLTHTPREASPQTLARFDAFARALATGLATTLGDALAPPSCAACDTRLNRRAVLCPACAAGVLPAPRLGRGGDVELVAFAIFGGPIANALRKLKYGDRPDLAGPLGHLLRRAARSGSVVAEVVVPVPLHPARLAERGFNQASLLAAAAAQELRAPLVSRALMRTRHTPQQARLTRAERLENVTGAFRVRASRASSVRDRRVVLVDDVATTGSTLAACASALRDAGASSVTALVVARADHDAEGDE